MKNQWLISNQGEEIREIEYGPFVTETVFFHSRLGEWSRAKKMTANQAAISLLLQMANYSHNT